MSEYKINIKLTNENWDDITNRSYHLTFLNERNSIRAILSDLYRTDDEIKRANIEMNKLKTKSESQLNYMEAKVKGLQENENLDIEQKNKLIAEKIAVIEKTNLEYSMEIEKYKLIKVTRSQAVNQNVEKLYQLKSQFKATHEYQIEALKRFRMFCHNQIRAAVGVRLRVINRKFCDELLYISSREKGLKHIISLIDDKSRSSDICSTASSSSVDHERYSEFLTDFAWMRNEQFNNRLEFFEYFKKYLAKDLISALSAMHVHKPDDPIEFIANYLKHLKQNEFRLKNQERIFAAAKYGESLFPEKNN